MTERASGTPQLEGSGREQGHGLLDVPSGGGPADPETRRKLGEHLVFAQVGQDQDGIGSL